MNYCTAENVRVMLGLPIAFNNTVGVGGTKPTLTQINEIIEDVTNIIDLQLSTIGITAQPTDSKVLSKLKYGCKIGVAAQAGFSYMNMSASLNDTKPKTYQDLFDAFLKEITENPEVYAVFAGAESSYAEYNDDETNAELIDVGFKS